MMKKVLIVAPHPDDETLGMGGTIYKLKDLKKEVHWVIGTNLSTEQGFTKERVSTRQKEIDEVARRYGFEGVHKLDFPTMRLDAIPIKDIIDALGGVISKVKPDTIFTPYRYDVHTDHRVMFDAILSCTKTFRAPFIKKLYMYEVISDTEYSSLPHSRAFIPNSYSDISAYVNKKIEIMKIYRSEMGIHPFPRSEETIRALAVVRGAPANYKYAEAFSLFRERW